MLAESNPILSAYGRYDAHSGHLFARNECRNIPQFHFNRLRAIGDGVHWNIFDLRIRYACHCYICQYANGGLGHRCRC